MLALQEIQSLDNVLLSFELVVENQLNFAVLVNHIGLSPGKRSKEITGDAPILAQLVSFITEECEWQSVFGFECLPQVIYN